MPPKIPTREELDRMNAEWVEPFDARTAPEGLHYGLYDTSVRGPGKQGSYWYVLPDGYQEDESKSYPVLIWLHGGMSRGITGAAAGLLYRDAMAAGLMTKTVIFFPQALPVGWYLNSIDGQFLIEDVLIKDFIPHIDATFRTTGQRGIEGFSMGGFGSSHLGLKFSDLFRAISCIAPAILPSLDHEPKEFVWDTFRGDNDYYQQSHPKTLLRVHQEKLRQAGIRIRLLAGSQDHRLTAAIESLHQLMDDAGVQHETSTVQDAGHDFMLILRGLGSEAYAFWNRAFEHKK
ncbi:hypothetical protein SCUCBS95973_009805 [Sporothrix curviconia]|uniref:Esterase n=1 Tax=Sporothrix curviconia TaxID=1260050 RepID=A0ABP0CYZ6_9PEZI